MFRDRACIARVAAAYRPKMVDHAARALGRHGAAAEDVVQDVFLAALEGQLPPIKDDRPAAAWLLDVVARFAHGERRAAGRRWRRGEG